MVNYLFQKRDRIPMKTKKKKNRTRILYAITVVGILLGGAAIYLNFRWKPILKERIKTIISNSTDRLYTIDFEDIQTNILTGRINIKNISFTPDSEVFDRMRADSIAPRHLFKVNVREIVLKRVRPWNIYFHKILDINSVIIDKPSLEVTFNNVKSQEDSVSTDNRTAYQRLLPYLKSTHVKEVLFHDADFKYIDNGGDVPRITSLKDLTIKVTDLLIDSASQFDRSRLYHTRDIYAELNNYSSITADSNYTVEIKQLTASTAKKYARITGFKLVPKLGEMEFSRSFKVQKDRYSVRAEELRLNNVDYKSLNTQRRLVASSLFISKANLGIFLNRERPDSLRNRGMNFPAISLQRFKLDGVVDTMILSDSRVDYSEYNPDSRRKGTVTFSKINGTILNITNNPAALMRNPFSEAHITSLLMDRGRFNVHMKFDLPSRDAAFTFKGDVGKMDADMFNSAIRPLSLIEIKSGQLQKMAFEGKGSLSGVSGSLACYYNGLKIALLEKSEKTTWLKRRGIASIFANVLIIEADNPSPGRAVRTEKFTYRRPEHSSFFNMIWKGMSSALLGSIGFDAETQREIKHRLRRMEQERFDREERRDDRQKRKIKRKHNRNERRN